MIEKPGFYDMPASEYHADPCPQPSLSHSIARVMLDRSPRHAFAAHPRFTKQPEKDVTVTMDAGSAIHKLLLGKGDDIKILPFDSYRKDAAKEAREAARAAHQIPILEPHIEAVAECAMAAEAQIRDHPDLAGFFGPGRSEVVIAWEENGIWFRSMIDRLADNGQMYDLKTTQQAAAPHSWERRLQTVYATQDAFYRRGLRALGAAHPPPILFVPVEQDAPYCISSLTPAQSLVEYAEDEIDRAVDLWRRCITTGKWPGYPAVTGYVEATGWQLARQGAESAEFQRIAYREKPSLKARHFVAKEFADDSYI